MELQRVRRRRPKAAIRLMIVTLGNSHHVDDKRRLLNLSLRQQLAPQLQQALAASAATAFSVQRTFLRMKLNLTPSMAVNAPVITLR